VCEEEEFTFTDFKNVSIVANYIKERTKDAQFIIISLRNNMFELADRLVGIYKTENSSKSITINPHLFSAPEPSPQAVPMVAVAKAATATSSSSKAAAASAVAPLQEKVMNASVAVVPV
jgi:structural maintenance of chromosome 4